MDTFADRLGRIGAWFGQNKYLGAIKNAFQNFMPATISGAIGANVLVNDTVVQGNAQGLGGLFKPIMVLAPINTVFAAISFCTISCISVGIVMLVGHEIATANGETGAFPVVLSFISWLVVTPTNFYFWEKVGSEGTTIANGAVLPSGSEAITNFTGIGSNYLGATGLFTALIVGIVAMEIFGFLRKQDALKIKMPEQVPPGVMRAFEVLIPACIMLVIVGAIGHFIYLGTGLYLNDLISTYIQGPLMKVVGENIIAVLFLYLLVSLFWLVGIHGANMISAVKDPFFRPLLIANMTMFQEGAKSGYHTINVTFLQMFGEMTGSGITGALVAAILIFGKREDNRAIASLSLVPGLFNINETVVFGIPMVLNPILGIPFILAPLASLLVGYFLITIGFCHPIVIEAPWTTPPLLFGFIATGGSITGAITQLISFVTCIFIYTPFLIFYERYQNKQANLVE